MLGPALNFVGDIAVLFDSVLIFAIPFKSTYASKFLVLLVSAPIYFNGEMLVPGLSFYRIFFELTLVTSDYFLASSPPSCKFLILLTKLVSSIPLVVFGLVSYS